MATPNNAPPRRAPSVAVDGTALLGAALRLGAAHETPAVSTQRHALAELVRAYRAIPGDALVRLPIAAPADRIERELGDGLRYAIASDGKSLRFELHDVTGDDAMAHLELDRARQLIRDLGAVIAAMEGRPR